jgi:hypothetical protein
LPASALWPAALPVQTTPAKDGWVSLFDGKTLNGWHTYGETTPTSTWTVSDGSIYFDPTLRAKGRRTISNDLVSAGEYENFHLNTTGRFPRTATAA